MRMNATQARSRPIATPAVVAPERSAVALRPRSVGGLSSPATDAPPAPFASPVAAAPLALVPREGGRCEDRIAVLTADGMLAFAVTSLTLGHFPTATVTKPELADLRDGRHLDPRPYSLLIIDGGLPLDLDHASLQRWLRPLRDTPVLLLADVADRCVEGMKSVTLVPRSVSPRGLAEAIEVVLSGKGAHRRQPERRQRRQEVDRITATQWRVIGYLGCGCSNKEIAFRMGISEATVKAHVGGAIARLGLTNRTEVALFAQRLTLGTRWAASAAAADVDA